MSRNDDFLPDWASPPGDTIGDILAEREVSVAAFADRLGQSEEVVDSLLRGKQAITTEIAGRLADVLGSSPSFWLNREAQYRVMSAGLRTKLIETVIEELPLKEMVKLKWLPPIAGLVQQVAASMRFFGTSDIASLRAMYTDSPELVAFRTSPSFPSEPAAVAAWLRFGELASAEIECAPWNKELLEQSLPAMRALTRAREPEEFVPKLREILAKCGVALVAARAPAGCRASGATRFLSESKALLLVSFRHLSDDHFWFSLFHELGHLLLHGKHTTFVDGADGVSDAKERAANDFAADTLIPKPYRDEMFRLPIDGRAVMRFARQLGISPGIVVGQLQYAGRFTRRQLNNLKRRYEWKD